MVSQISKNWIRRVRRYVNECAKQKDADPTQQQLHASLKTMLEIEQENDQGQMNRELDELEREAMCSPRVRLAHAIRFDKQASQRYFVTASSIKGTSVSEFTANFVRQVIDRSVVTVAEATHGQLGYDATKLEISPSPGSAVCEFKKQKTRSHMGLVEQHEDVVEEDADVDFYSSKKAEMAARSVSPALTENGK